MRTLPDILQKVPTSPENGLSPEGLVQSRQFFGVNRLTPLPREPLWKKFLEKFDEPIIKILLGAALLSMFVDLFQEGANLTAGVGVGLLAVAVAALYVLRKTQWIPTLLFGSAIV